MCDVTGYPEPLSGPSLDSPAEERHDVDGSRRSSKDTVSKSKRKRSCPMFGVKSYLHQFYDDTTFKDPCLYEDDDSQFLLQPHHRRRRCTPIWWKIFMWVGVILLVFGVVSILVGYMVPPHQFLIKIPGDSHAYVDTKAQVYNATLDMCKLTGLVLFCVGGATLAMALLFPIFLAHYCDEDTKDYDPGIKVPMYDGEKDPHHHMAIPASSKVKNVQPEKKCQQQNLVTTEEAKSQE